MNPWLQVQIKIIKYVDYLCMQVVDYLYKVSDTDLGTNLRDRNKTQFLQACSVAEILRMFSRKKV